MNQSTEQYAYVENELVSAMGNKLKLDNVGGDKIMSTQETLV
jgi:hypothetical protein